MTSNDANNGFITVEMFNAGIREIKHEMAEMLKELRQEIKDTRNELMTEIRINQVEMAHVQTSVYWGFAIVGIIIAFVGLYPFRKDRTERSEDLSPRNIRDIRAIIREEIALSNGQLGIRS